MNLLSTLLIQLSQDFENIKVKDFNYSSYDFLKCSKDEQETFFND